MPRCRTEQVQTRRDDGSAMATGRALECQDDEREGRVAGQDQPLETAEKEAVLCHLNLSHKSFPANRSLLRTSADMCYCDRTIKGAPGMAQSAGCAAGGRHPHDTLEDISRGVVGAQRVKTYQEKWFNKGQRPAPPLHGSQLLLV
ncbi:hypothetical protein CB1_000092002 [Camelus ferus]|nr:hypothetical protein CB1_000092002 [Camelus ferus]